MQVWGCVGCVGVLLPARTPSDQSMDVRPPPSAGYPLTSLRPGALSVDVVLHSSGASVLNFIMNPCNAFLFLVIPPCNTNQTAPRPL
jgi:hypothetical protein